VGPSDELRINVWRDNDLSRELKVRADGTLTMPLIGDVKAAGRTPSQIREEIERRVRQYVKTEAGQVTVSVIAVNSYRFSVLGNVERPGLFNSAYYVTVLEALALAGGANRFADPDKAVIIRTYAPGTTRQIPVQLDHLAKGERPEQNIVLMPGDTMYIP
jgi:polysaccharide biosynthesis/export protein